MIREQRLSKIKDALKQTGIVSINELTESLGASRSTILRDLHDLEKNNELKCTRGGAVITKHMTSYEPPFNVRKEHFTDEKKRIVTAAMTLIQEKETLLLDSGTTVYALAQELKDAKNLYIATNDLNSAMTLAANPDISLIVLGGTLRNGHYSLNGYFTEGMLSQIHADKVFLGVDAVDLNIGFMNFSVEEIQTKRLMIQASHEVIVLCDHSKFETVAFANICSFKDVDLIITGKEIDKTILEKLQELDVRVMTV